MTTSAISVDARRGLLARVCTGATLLLDAGHGTVRVPLRGQRALPGDEPGMSYRKGPFLVTVVAAADAAVYLTLQDQRELECMPLAWECTNDPDDAARILAVMLGAILAPERMWPVLDVMAGVVEDRQAGLPMLDEDACITWDPIAAWTDDVPMAVSQVAGLTGTDLEPGRVGRFVRAQGDLPAMPYAPSWLA